MQDGRLSELEAVFELVDSVRADQESKIQTLAAEVEKMRVLLEQSVGHSLDAIRSEITNTLQVRALSPPS